MKLADLTRHEYARIGLCFHEASHAVAGVVLGSPLAKATVADGTVRAGVIGRPSGSTTFSAVRTDGVTMQAVAFAGPWGEARWRLGRRPSQPEVGAVMQDHDREALLASGDFSTAEAVAVPLLERLWPGVTALAVHLFSHGSATQADVFTALRLSDDPTTRELELSLIRAGYAPDALPTRPPS